jgi:hypothetical protein
LFLGRDVLLYENWKIFWRSMVLVEAGRLGESDGKRFLSPLLALCGARPLLAVLGGDVSVKLQKESDENTA